MKNVLNVKVGTKRIGCGENKPHQLTQEGKNVHKVFVETKGQKNNSLSRSSDGRN